MSDKGKVTLIVCLGAAFAILIGAVLWHHYAHASGLFIGFGVGIGFAVAAYPVGQWLIER